MRCGICHGWPIVDPVRPGPGWGTCCRACFVEADRASEAAEALWWVVPAADPDNGDLSGRRFGRLTVIGPTRKWNRLAWLVRCDCGAERVVETTALRTRGLAACVRCSNRQTSQARAMRFGGELVSEVAQRAGLATSTVRHRVKRGLRSVTGPVRVPVPPDRTRRFGGRTVVEIARAAGLTPKSIWSRIVDGWPVERLAEPRKRPPTRGNTRRAA